MKNHVIVLVFLSLSSFLGCNSMQRVYKTMEDNQPNLDKSAIAEVELYIMHGWHDSYDDGSFMLVDLVAVKIIEPKRYTGIEVSILDTDEIFRNKSLTMKGTKVKLTLYNSITLSEVIEKDGFLPVKDVSPYDSDK